MRSRIAVCTLALAVTVLSANAFLQVAGGNKGGEEETGPYDFVPNWPQPFARQGYIQGSIAGVFAETPNRVFVAMRGELKLPEQLPRNFNGSWGSFGERGASTEHIRGRTGSSTASPSTPTEISTPPTAMQGACRNSARSRGRIRRRSSRPRLYRRSADRAIRKI
jgi:hypothetical protein